MSKSTSLIALACAALLAACATPVKNDPITLTLGTATPGGGFPVYGAAFKDTVQEADPTITIDRSNPIEPAQRQQRPHVRDAGAGGARLASGGRHCPASAGGLRNDLRHFAQLGRPRDGLGDAFQSRRVARVRRPNVGILGELAAHEPRNRTIVADRMSGVARSRCRTSSVIALSTDTAASASPPCARRA